MGLLHQVPARGNRRAGGAITRDADRTTVARDGRLCQIVVHAVRLPRAHPCVRVVEHAEVCPVVADEDPADAVLHRGVVDGVLILRRRVLGRSAVARQRHIELDHIAAVRAAMCRGQHPIAVVAEEPRRAAHRHQTRVAIVKAQRAIIDAEADRAITLDRGRGLHTRNMHTIHLRARIGRGHDLDLDRAAVEVRGGIAPLLQRACIEVLLVAVTQRGDPQVALANLLRRTGKNDIAETKTDPVRIADLDDLLPDGNLHITRAGLEIAHTNDPRVHIHGDLTKRRLLEVAHHPVVGITTGLRQC